MEMNKKLDLVVFICSLFYCLAVVLHVCYKQINKNCKIEEELDDLSKSVSRLENMLGNDYVKVTRCINCVKFCNCDALVARNSKGYCSEGFTYEDRHNHEEYRGW